MNSRTIAKTNCKAPGSAGTVARATNQPQRSEAPLRKGQVWWASGQKKDSLWWNTFFLATPTPWKCIPTVMAFNDGGGWFILSAAKGVARSLLPFWWLQNLSRVPFVSLLVKGVPRFWGNVETECSNSVGKFRFVAGFRVAFLCYICHYVLRAYRPAEPFWRNVFFSKYCKLI